jgi:pimeloyl-ACP methyl ester carboxylesterase
VERLEVETRFGPVWLWGEDTGRPVILILNGAFADVEGIGSVRSQVFDVFNAHLPGNHCPDLVRTNIGVWSSAFGEALARAFPERPLLVAGISTGALIALGLRSPSLKRLVLVEPPLWPTVTWPFREFPGQTPDWGDDMLWNVFGVGSGRFEPRDYRHLLDNLQCPAIAIVGSIPLQPPREGQGLPSLVDEESRRRLEAHPLVELRVAAGVGHNIPRDASHVLASALRDAADRVLLEL